MYTQIPPVFYRTSPPLGLLPKNVVGWEGGDGTGDWDEEGMWMWEGFRFGEGKASGGCVVERFEFGGVGIGFELKLQIGDEVVDEPPMTVIT